MQDSILKCSVKSLRSYMPFKEIQRQAFFEVWKSSLDSSNKGHPII